MSFSISPGAADLIFAYDLANQPTLQERIFEAESDEFENQLADQFGFRLVGKWINRKARRMIEAKRRKRKNA